MAMALWADLRKSTKRSKYWFSSIEPIISLIKLCSQGGMGFLERRGMEFKDWLW